MRALLIVLVAGTLASSVLAGDKVQPANYHEVAVISYKAADFEAEELFDQKDFVLEKIKYEPQEMEKVAVDISDISFTTSIDQ